MTVKLAERIDKFNRFTGEKVAWLNLIVVILVFSAVILRYMFGYSGAWVNDLIQYLHAFIFLSAAGYVLLENEHVRVDLFYVKLSSRQKDYVNLFGTTFFLFPLCIAYFFFSLEFVTNSWKIWERSREINGIPAIFIFKSFMWFFIISVILQGVSLVINIIKRLPGVVTS